MPPEVDFSEAFREAKAGKKIRRSGWNGKGQYVIVATDVEAFHRIEDHTIYLEDSLVLKNAQDQFIPWLPSMGDLFAEDWQVVE